MDRIKAHLSANWKKYALGAAAAAAAAYAGPAGSAAVQEYLPQLCAAIGVC